MPGILSRLLPVLGASYAQQIALALIFVPLASEKFYDGAATGFLTATFTSLAYDRGVASLADLTYTLAPRQILLSIMVALWAIRTGTFMLSRTWVAGGDSRFDDVKHHPGKFTAFWIAQATYVFLVGFPVYSINVLPKLSNPDLGFFDFLGLGLFISGWMLEIVADTQKSGWRRQRDIPVEKGGHGEKFITSGLWSISRHPNYVGEVTLWFGIYVSAASGLFRSPFVPQGFWLVPAISPFMTWLLLRHASGVPALEEAGDKKFGDDPKWKAYKKEVPIFWPFTN